MSIAVSAVVHPSRLLRMMVATMAVIAGVVAVLIGTSHSGELSPGLRFALSTTTFFLALFGFYHGVRDGKTIQLDISGTGLIRIVEMGARGACVRTKRPHVRNLGEPVRLMQNSTIWPNLLLLILQSDSGRITVLPILPDCVSRDSFRALSVACRWIAKNNPPEPDIL